MTTSGKKQPLFAPDVIADFGRTLKEWKQSEAPVYLTLTAAAMAADADPETIHGTNGIAPAAWYSRNGKRFPLYDQGRVLEWALQRAQKAS